MTTVLRALPAIDELARRGRAGGACYHDHQDDSRYEPAIEHPRHVLHELLTEVAGRGPLRTVVEVGAGRFGVRHEALRQLARCVVTVDPDPERLRPLGHEPAGPDTATSHTVLGHGHEPAVVAEVQRLAPGVDLLLLDGSDRYAAMAAAWRALAGLVRPGGTVAIVDRSQQWPEGRRDDDVDRFTFDLAERYLRPRGRSLRRHGTTHNVVTYVRTDDDDEAAARWPEPLPSAPPWVEDLAVAGFRIGQDGAHWLAGRGGPTPLGHRAALRQEAPLAFVAETREALLERLHGWSTVETLATAGLAALANAARTRFTALTAAAAAVPAGTTAWLVDALQATPRSCALLRTVGAFWLLQGQHDLGAALLRQVIDLDLGDTEVLRALAETETWLRGDPAAARALLTTVRARLADRERSRVCLQELRGHALWTQPRLLHRHDCLTWIGPGGEAGIAAAARLGMRMLWWPNDPAATAATTPLVGGPDQHGTWWRDPRDGTLAQRPWTATYGREQGRAQVPVAVDGVRTLDDLLASGALTPERLQVLVLDVPGAVHEVLRGAARALQAVQTLCVRIHHQAVFAGGEPHPAMLGWLREQGLHLLGCEATDDPTAAFALLQRPRP